MNSSDYEPWMFQPTSAYANSWLTETFARDAETLTRALQKTISGDTNTNNTNNNSDAFITSSDAVSSFCKTETTPSLSGSDLEMAANSNRRRVVGKQVAGTTGVGVVTKKITKRKPRVSKKCQTTVIMADPANFRQMVQQVTGVRLETLHDQQSQSNQLIVKPEPKRLKGTGLPLPTLDTSSFFVDHSMINQQQQGVGLGVAGCGGQRGGWLTGCDDEVGQMAYVDSLIGVGGTGYGYESYQCFPTLESWN